MTLSGARIVAVIGALATAAAVTSCSTSPSPHQHVPSAISGSNAQPTERNADDVAFAVNMMPHHQQAVEMSAMVPSRSANPQLLVVAQHISSDQQAEILTFEGLVLQWHEPSDGHSGHTGVMTMAGMVDPATMNRLRSLRGAEFEQLWLRSMIRHHQGAITMAQNELAHGESPDARQLAEMIITAQRREIAQMTDLLNVTE